MEQMLVGVSTRRYACFARTASERAKYAASARAWLLSVSSKPSRKEALSTLK